MQICLSTTDSITLELVAAVTANEPEFIASYIDTTGDTPGSTKGATNGTTPVTAVAAPAADERLVYRIDVCNIDTAEVTIVLKVAGGTARTVIKHTLAASASVNLLDLPPASSGGGVTDHGALTGLADDDHTQYLRATGARAGSSSEAQSFGATGIKADVIAEHTGAAGVTVDGVLLKDGGIVCADAATIEVDTVNEATGANGVTVDGLKIKDAGFALTDDADGDVYYRASGALARLAKGTAGQVFTMNGTATAPEWAAAGGSSFATGMVMQTVGASAPSGWVILTGASAVRTIGSAASGADRANADTETLYALLWDSMADAQAPVSSGRGASAAGDFAADKTITIPDPRGRALIGTGTGSGLTARTHGATGGAETHQLSVGELASHSHVRYAQAAGSESSAPLYAAANGTEVDFSTNGSQGSDTAHANMQPWLALNLICKL